VKTKIRQQLNSRQRKIGRRLDKTKFPKNVGPVFRGGNLRYEIAERVHGLGHGGIALFHQLAQNIGLVSAIDARLPILKIRLPYSESDHVLNLAFNGLCGGDCLQDLELRRNDSNYLDALGAQRIPDPTTAGDFCRRFDAARINRLQDIYDDVRIGVWQHQPHSFFDQAILDADGTLTATTGQCKQGMDISYNGIWGYHVLVVSLANTREVLRLVNRPANRPSHEGAAGALDQAIATCLRGGFRKVLLRGDTDFSQTEHLDHWDDDGRIQFIFGYDAKDNLKDLAEQLPAKAWRKLQRPPRYHAVTGLRHRPDNVKDKIVRARGFETLRLQSEEVAEFNYRPSACGREYRMIVVRKNISKEKGELLLQDEIRYLFYITNDWTSEADEIVFCANDRCHQENLLQQLKNGVHALTAPVDNLESNWAYMVMTSLAWSLKAWAALRLPETGRWAEKYQADKLWLLGLEFKAFVQAFVAIPCQIVRQARRLVCRVLCYHQHLPVFFRLAEVLNC
jgi:Transposase DDE domain group 1